MDWENERYVRVYVRDTVDDAVLSWEALALWNQMLRKMDRSGVIDVGRHGAMGLAALVRIPLHVVEPALLELIGDGRIVVNPNTNQILAPNYMHAQEARQSDKLRQAESRARRRDLSQNVTERHELSQPVTPCHTVSPQPSLPVLSLALSCSPEGEREQFKPVPEERTEVTRSSLESVYAKYPRKKGKAPGLKKAQRLIRTRDVFARYQACVEWMADAWAGADLEFCPYFSTFINEERWNDEEWPSPKKTNGNGGHVHKLNLVKI